MSKRYIPRFKLVASADEPDARKIGYAWADTGIGQRHQIGGTPITPANQNWPVCKSCKDEMTFFGQLDAPGDDFDLADCHVVQVFVCYDCFETHSRLSQL